RATAPVALRAIVAVYLLLPQIPMLFMGEEWAASQPFLFFCDFAGELGAAVRAGRCREFARFQQFQEETMQARIADPQARSTFESAKLAGEQMSEPEHATWLQFYRQLLAVRHASIVP